MRNAVFCIIEAVIDAVARLEWSAVQQARQRFGLRWSVSDNFPKNPVYSSTCFHQRRYNGAQTKPPAGEVSGPDLKFIRLSMGGTMEVIEP